VEAGDALTRRRCSLGISAALPVPPLTGADNCITEGLINVRRFVVSAPLYPKFVTLEEFPAEAQSAKPSAPDVY